MLTLRVKHGGVLEERVLMDRHSTALGRGLHAGPWYREGLYERKYGQTTSVLIKDMNIIQHRVFEAVLCLLSYRTGRIGNEGNREQIQSGFKPVTLYVCVSVCATTTPQI